MNAKQAIRDDLKEVSEKIRSLQAEEKALNIALAAINGAKPEERKRRSPLGGHRTPLAKRVQQAREEMSANPTRVYRPGDLKIPKSTSYPVIAELLRLGEVEKVDETGRGKPIVRWKGGAPVAPATPEKQPQRDPLPGGPAKPVATKPRKPRRKKQKRVPVAKRAAQVLDLMRADPHREFKASELAKEQGIDTKTIRPVLKSLSGKVHVRTEGVGPTAPKFYRYKDATVVPGLGVREPRSFLGQQRS